MTMLRRAAVAALVSGSALAVGQPAQAAGADSGALDITASQAAHPTCAKAAKALVRVTGRDFFLRRTAFTGVRRPRLVAANVASENMLPNGQPVVSTDLVRCVGTATRKGSRRPQTVYYAITKAPDLIEVFDQLTSVVDGALSVIALPAATYSLTYQTGQTPGW